jgi:hypothetical protein
VLYKKERENKIKSWLLIKLQHLIISIHVYADMHMNYDYILYIGKINPGSGSPIIFFKILKLCGEATLTPDQDLLPYNFF